MDNSYSVVFTGRLAADFTLEQVRTNFLRLFKLSDPALLDRVFSGQRVLLKKGMTAAEAQRHCATLLAAGAVCEIDPQPAVATPPQSKAEPSSTEMQQRA